LLDRLALNDARVRRMAEGVRTIAALDDPVAGHRGVRPAGRAARAQGSRPSAFVAIVYEARPNVTIDAMALSLNAGNATVLRGSSSAAHSNAILASIAPRRRRRRACRTARSRSWRVAVGGAGGARDAGGIVDLIVPRGGEGLKAALKDVATVP